MLDFRTSSNLVDLPSILGGMNLGERLKLAREMRGLSQVALAKAVGVSPQAISLIENGMSKGLRPENLVAAADALEIRVCWLATGIGPMMDTNNDNLDRDAIHLAGQYSQLTEEQRAMVSDLIQAMLSRTPPAASGKKGGRRS